jgi:hypothetical protein
MGHALSSFSQHVAKIPQLPFQGGFSHLSGEQSLKVFAELRRFVI